MSLVAPLPTRTLRHGDRTIHVYDDLFPEKTTVNFANVVSSLDYQRRESFDRELSTPIDADLFRSAPFLFPTTEALFDAHAKSEFGVDDAGTTLSHVYAAAMDSSACGTVHRDIDDPNAVTFLYYANLVWRGRWGGETTFYDDDMDAIYTVTPRPGRLVLFHSNILHRAGVPHPDTPTYRYTVSVFYYPKRVAKRQEE